MIGEEARLWLKERLLSEASDDADPPKQMEEWKLKTKTSWADMKDRRRTCHKRILNHIHIILYYNILSYLILSYLILSYLILSYLILNLLYYNILYYLILH